MNITATVTEWNSYDLSEQINTGLRDGFALNVNGLPVVGQYGRPASVYAFGNGTISFETPSKTSKSGTRPVYVKVGETLTVAPR